MQLHYLSPQRMIFHACHDICGALGSQAEDYIYKIWLDGPPSCEYVLTLPPTSTIAICSMHTYVFTWLISSKVPDVSLNIITCLSWPKPGCHQSCMS